MNMGNTVDKKEEKRPVLKKRKSLQFSMIYMMIFGWFLPLILLISMVNLMVTDKINTQIQQAVVSSANKASEILMIQLEACETASKNASYLSVIRNAYNEYGISGDGQAFQETVSTFLNQQYRFDRNFRSAVLVFPEYPQKNFFTFNNSKNGTYKDIDFFEKYVQADLLMHMEELDTKTELISYGGRIYMVRNLVDSKFHPYAVLALELNKESILEGIYNIIGYENVIIYKNGEEFLSPIKGSSIGDDGEVRQKLANEPLFFEKVNGKESYLYNRIDMYNGEFDIAICLDNSVLYAEMQAIKYVFIILTLFLFPLICLTLWFCSSRITKPIQEMVRAFNVVKEGKYGTQIEKIGESEEFFQMKEAFNHMSSQLQYQFEKIYKEEIALRDARIMALQSQINPHFLNNTLEIINWEARLNENYKVSQMIEALSTMLEASMNRRAQPFNTIAEEMAYVDAYLYIISQRLGEKFQCKKVVDESLLNCMIPRLIIQPIVENAVEHGMDVTRKGEVILRLYKKEEGILCIEIEDNGSLSEADSVRIHRLLSEELDPLNEKHVSLGIRNVDRRLKMLYGEGYGLFIASNKNSHTVSTILVKIDERTEQ